MQKRNTIIIGIVSILIMVFMFVSVSSKFRYKIRQFIGDDTSSYYFETIQIPEINGTMVEVIAHTIVKLNNSFIGYSVITDELIVINTEMELYPYMNTYTQNCSSCHQE